MQKYTTQQKLIALGAVVVIIIGGCFLFIHSKKNLTTPPSSSAPASADKSAPVIPITSTSSVPIQTPPPLPVGTDRFVVTLTDTADTIAANLQTGGYITDTDAFVNSVGAKPVAPGGYKISNTMTPAQLLQVLRGKPYMKWVVIPPGLRKEEIAALLAPALGWTSKQKTEWLTKDTTANPDYIEGVYAPDTYLIPVSETPAEVATRLIDQFNEGFAPYLPQFTAKNIKWTSALTLASIEQREAANVADMPLIAGILWNRLNANMPLDVDATIQYIRGDTASGWWAPISVADIKIDSPYNTYEHTGLPPHPISNPSLDAINAVLNPAVTDCLYYLHDSNHVTHCAATYAEHEANIQLYLQSTAQPTTQTQTSTN